MAKPQALSSAYSLIVSPLTSWHILYMLNQFDRHEMDAIVGEDPWEQDETPKWADCDKSVTNFDDQRPNSISKCLKSRTVTGGSIRRFHLLPVNVYLQASDRDTTDRHALTLPSE